MKNREPNLKKPVCSAVHKVAAGETLYRIARRYGVDYGRLMALNGITNPYNVKPGTEICIPPAAGTESGSSCAGYYVIREGDTLYRIAKNFGISLESLMAANSDVDPYNMHIGMKLCIPPRNGELQNPGSQRPGRPSAPGGQKPGTPSMPGGQRPGTPSAPGNQQNQRPGSSGQTRPPQQGSGGVPIMPRTVQSDTAHTESASASPSESQSQIAESTDSTKPAQPSTGAAVMNALGHTGGNRTVSDTRATTDSETQATENPDAGSSAVYAEMTADHGISDSSASDISDIRDSDLQMQPSETTNLDTMSVTEQSHSDPLFRPFVSDTMPDGILYRVEQGETLTDILKKFGICFSALHYSNSSVDLSEDLTGLTLTIPYGDRFCTAPDNQRYVIRKNDDLDSLSFRFNIPTDDLLRMNPMKKPEDFSNTGSRINISSDL